MKIEKIIKKLDINANQIGFKPAKFAKNDFEPGIELIKKWKLGKYNFVLLYLENDCDYWINFSNSIMSGNDPVEFWLNIKIWKQYFENNE